ncbi:MAG: proline dehydrogenase family protein [Bacteroidia bacterium]|nr:proline dehydrogenase family protein [Bacteroidia bacterium]MCX7651920.1 proline dehydrogenase family protein [Bacteroidia bacterium]MDW8416071.1 proline dehydrogenase family protein [Bacteroidia bacterium]
MSILHATTGVDLDDTQVGYAYRSTEELQLAYFLFRLLRYGRVVKIANKLGDKALRWGLPIQPILRNTLGRLFLGGETLSATLPLLRRLRQYNLTAMLDYAVEASHQIEAQEKALQEYVRMVEFAGKYPELVGYIAVKLTALASPTLWEKLSQGGSLPTYLIDEEKLFHERFSTLMQTAQRYQVPLMIDAEESWIQPAIDSVAEHYMQLFNSGDNILLYTTVQMYRRDRLAYIEKLLNVDYTVGIKLVRGAYVEKERQRAQTYGYPDPIHPTKAATDIAYDQALMMCLENIDRMALCVATHNRNSCMKAVQYAFLKKWAPDHPRLSFSQLYGMADPLSFGLAKAGFRVAKYVPYGPIDRAFPYLSRRAEENSSLSDQSGRELRWVAEELLRRRKGRD